MLFLYMQLFHFHLLEQFFHTGGSGIGERKQNLLNKWHLKADITTWLL